MELNGRIKKIFETQEISPSFRKREVVITTQEQYPQDIIVEFTQDKTDLLNAYRLGSDVRISINIRGREWVNPEGVAKYFNSIQGWRIENLDQNETNISSNESTDFKPADNITTFNKDEDDDLPF